jgi:NTP pyrophosphatase (non-canonical NTP hydrolase)
LSAVEIQEAQRAMDEFVRSRGWYGPQSPKPQQPRNLAVSLAIEAGELLEHFQWEEPADRDQVGAELADVVLYALQLATVLDLDLGEAVRAKLGVNEQRWAPAA